MTNPPKLRVARPSDNLDALLPFYRDGLGLSLLRRFEDHDGYDGIILGCEGAAYHLEFTRAHGHRAGKAPTQDNLLVLYIPEPAEWRARGGSDACRRFSPCARLQPLLGSNRPDLRGPDGYRVVLQRDAWNL